MRAFQSHGNGEFLPNQFSSIGTNVILEKDVLVWHPETVSLGSNIYVGHRTMLKGHPKGKLIIRDHVWIGQNVFLHSAGSITIESHVGIGPGVIMLTSSHEIPPLPGLILDSPLKFSPIHIEEGVDIGVGSILLPGIKIGQGAQIGAGSIVTKDIEPYTIVAGNPAKLIRKRP